MPLTFPIFAAGSMKSEQMLFTVLVQLLVIMTAARVFGSLFRALRQPMVVGEIAAGLILGPSCFGHFFPETSAAIFDPAVSDVFGVLSQLGLILLLFVVGLEFDFSHLKVHGQAAVAISLTGILLPFALGGRWAWRCIRIWSRRRPASRRPWRDSSCSWGSRCRSPRSRSWAG